MSAAWFVEGATADGDPVRKVCDTFEEALFEFMKLIWEDGAEAASLRWSS